MKTAARLAELCAIRDRELTVEEQREVQMLARRDRWNQSRQRRYWADPDYRRQTIYRTSYSTRRLKREAMEAAE